MRIKTDINQMTDEALMKLFIEEKQDIVFEHLYQKQYPMLCKYLAWLTQDFEQGKDMAQNIFLKIYQRPELFDPSKNFKVWLFSIAKNQWKNELRNEAIRQKHLTFLSAQPDFSFSENTENDIRLKQMQTALEKLSEAQREVFILKYSNNLTLSEISEICNCSVGTVKSRLFYALKNLKKELK